MDLFLLFISLLVVLVGVLLMLELLFALPLLATIPCVEDFLLQGLFCVWLSGIWSYPAACVVLVTSSSAHLSMWIMKYFGRLVTQLLRRSFKKTGPKCLRRIKGLVISATMAVSVAAFAASVHASSALRMTPLGYDLNFYAGRYSSSFTFPSAIVSLIEVAKSIDRGARGTEMWKCVDKYGTVALHSQWTVPMEFYISCSSVELPNYDSMCVATDKLGRIMHLIMYALERAILRTKDLSSNVVTKFSHAHTPSLHEAALFGVKGFAALTLLNLLFNIKYSVKRVTITHKARESRDSQRSVGDSNYRLTHENHALRQFLRVKIVKLQKARRSKYSMRLAFEKKRRTQKEHGQRMQELERRIMGLEKELESARRDTSPALESAASSSREGTPVSFNFDDSSSIASDMTTTTDIEEDVLEIRGNTVSVHCAKAARSGAVNDNVVVSRLHSEASDMLTDRRHITIATVDGVPTYKMLPPHQRLAVAQTPFYLLRAMNEGKKQGTGMVLDVNEVD